MYLIIILINHVCYTQHTLPQQGYAGWYEWAFGKKHRDTDYWDRNTCEYDAPTTMLRTKTETSNETPTETSNETSNETPTETPNETPTETSNETQKYFIIGGALIVITTIIATTYLYQKRSSYSNTATDDENENQCQYIAYVS
jgi:hypothetical protein